MDPDGKTLLYGSFRPVNGQSINNFFSSSHSRTLYSGICCLSLLFSYRPTDLRTLRAAKTLGDDTGFCFCFFAVIFRGKCLVQFFSLLSFPNVVVGNLLFVVAVILESRSPGSVVRRTCSLAKPRDPRQKPSGMTEETTTEKDPLLIIRAYGKGGPYGTTLFFFIKNVTPRHKFVK